jgi:hypothetical protein
MLHGLFDQRDCIMIKSTSLNNTSVCTSSKIQSHSIEKGKLKPIFGNFVCGGLLVRLVQSFAFHFSNHQTTKFVLQTIVRNVYVKFWQDLLNQAYSTYCDSMHLRLSTYDKIEMDAQYLKELMIDEKKIIHEDVDGHQGFINEFAHLKRQEEPQTNGNDDHKDNQKSSSSNKSLLKYIKHRAGKVMSSLTSRHSSIGSVDPIQLEEQQKHQISFTCNTKSKSKSMPVDITELDRCHSIALADAKSIVSSFLKLKTPTTMDTTSAGTNELNVLPLLQKWTIDVDLNDGKKKLMKKIKTKQKEFEIANATASAFFCSEVLKYLHSVLLQKIENELGSTNNTNQMTSNKSDSFSKIPLELLLYKNNIEEMISQYNFIAKGPFAKKILVSFLQTPVRLHVLSLVTKESNQFQEQIALQKLQMNQSKDQLNQAQETLTKYNLQKEILLQEEAYQISQIEQAHQEKAEKLHNAILHTNEKIQKTLKEQQVLYEKTINATKTTIHTFNQVIAKKNRFFMGYLEQFEACFFKNKWQQKFFVLDGPMLKCFKAKSIYEERGLPCEPSICLTGYTILPSTTDDAKIKVISSKITAHGQKLLVLRFRVPISVERETWIRKLKEATQMTK